MPNTYIIILYMHAHLHSHRLGETENISPRGGRCAMDAILIARYRSASTASIYLINRLTRLYTTKRSSQTEDSKTNRRRNPVTSQLSAAGCESS